MLFWMPRRVTTANAIINSLANYSDWLSENRELEGFLSISDTCYDERINWAAWHHKRNRAFQRILGSFLIKVRSDIDLIMPNIYNSSKLKPQKSFRKSILLNCFLRGFQTTVIGMTAISVPD